MLGVVEAIVLLNALSFALFAVDKKRAADGRWRIPEWVLLLSAAIYGAFGALCGMYFCNHKTHKPLFYITIPLFLLLQTIGTIVLFFIPD